MKSWMSREGSTRHLGLMRIGLVLLIWARWADELALHRNPQWWPLAVVFYLSTTAMFFGFYSRISTTIVAGTLAYMVGSMGWFQGQHGWIHHHTHLLMHATLLLALTPCGRSLSIDRWRSGAPEVGPLWAVPLLGMQCSAVYFFSAIDKTTMRFLSGDHLMGILATRYTGSEPIELPTALFVVASVSVVALEYVLPFALWVRRWQRWVMPIGLLLHGLFYLLLPVGTFSLTMALLYLAYLHPDDVEKLSTKLFVDDQRRLS